MSSSSVDISEWEKKLREYQQATGKSWPVVIREEGRAMAVSLARSTQPYTSQDDWNASWKVGKAKVDRDIKKVYATGGDVFEAMKRQGEDGLGDAWYYFYQANQIGGKRGAQALLEVSKTAFRSLKIEKLNPSHHKSARGRGGRVGGSGKRFAQIVKNDGQLSKYSEARQKLVGFAKGGWAACARLLGSVRPIPGWITRQKSPGRIRDNSKSEVFPYVDLTNSVDYVSSVLSAGEEEKAYRIGRGRLTKKIEETLAKIAAKFNSR